MEGGEWSNFNATVCVNEEADFMAQLFPNPNDVNLNYNRHHHHHHHNSSSHTYDIMANNNNNNNKNNNGEGGSSYIISCDSTTNSQNLYRYSQVSSYSRSSQDHDEVHYHNYFSDNHHELAAAAANNNNDASSLAIDFLPCNMEVDHDNNGMHDDDESQMEPELVGEDKISNCSYDSKKRPRAALELKVQRQKMKKKLRVKRSQSSLSLGGDEEEEKDGNAVNGQSSSSGSLEDDCSSKGTTTTTTTTTTTALNSNGKTRASRGSATDPQSLYARKRRERINERLKILQGLVPNGTKVDISTMLEEAVQYVKFLQLQIKLLSSDELWMYAPIAYNGMNIGIDFKINLPR